MALLLLAVAALLPIRSAPQGEAHAILSMDKAQRVKALAASPEKYVPILIQALQDRRVATRRAAVSALRDFDPPGPNTYYEGSPAVQKLRPSVVTALAKAGRDPDRRVREGAVRALVTELRVRTWGNEGQAFYRLRSFAPLTDLGRDIVPTLLTFLKPGSFDNQGSQVAALVTLRMLKDRRALPILIRVIDRSWGACMDAAMLAITEIPDARVAPAIVRNIDNETDIEPATPGIYAIRRLSKREAVPALIRGLTRSKSVTVRESCAKALASIVDSRSFGPLLAAMQSPKESVRAQAAYTLSEYPLNPRSVHALALAAHDPSPSVRAAAVSALVSLRSQKNIVFKALQDPSREVRSRAIGIVHLDRDVGIPAVLPLMSDPDCEDRVLWELRSIHDRRTIPAFLKVLETKAEYERFGEDAGMALAEMKVPEAIPLLIDRLMDDRIYSPAVRPLALYGRAPADALLARLPGQAISQPIIEALGNTGDPRAADLLLPLIGDPKLVGDVAIALGKLHDQRAVAPLIEQLNHQSSDTASHIAVGLGYLGSHLAVQPLISKMKDKDARWSVAEALAKIGDPACVDSLVDYLLTHPALGAMALEKGPNFHDPRIFALLIKALSYEDEGAPAATVLGTYGDRRALAPLRQAAASHDPHFAQAVAEAIRRIQASPSHADNAHRPMP